MKTIILLTFAYCFSSFAQEAAPTIKVKLSDITMSSDGMGLEMDINDEVLLDVYLDYDMLDEKYPDEDYDEELIYDHVILKYVELKSLYPNGTIEITLDEDKDGVLVNNEFKLIDKGSNDSEEVAKLKAENAALKIMLEQKMEAANLATLTLAQDKLKACEAQVESLNQTVAQYQTNINAQEEAETQALLDWLNNLGEENTSSTNRSAASARN